MSREEKPPQPGYAAMLLGDDVAQVMSPLLTVMTATAALNAANTLNNVIQSPGIANPGMGANLGVSAVAPPSNNPFAGGPSRRGP